MPLTPEELDMLPARVSLADVTLEMLQAYVPNEPPVASFRGVRSSRRRIWRGIDGGQSVLILQVLGQMWGRWNRWGMLRVSD